MMYLYCPKMVTNVSKNTVITLKKYHVFKSQNIKIPQIPYTCQIPGENINDGSEL